MSQLHSFLPSGDKKKKKSDWFIDVEWSVRQKWHSIAGCSMCQCVCNFSNQSLNRKRITWKQQRQQIHPTNSRKWPSMKRVAGVFQTARNVEKRYSNQPSIFTHLYVNEEPLYCCHLDQFYQCISPPTGTLCSNVLLSQNSSTKRTLWYCLGWMLKRIVRVMLRLWTVHFSTLFTPWHSE